MKVRRLKTNEILGVGSRMEKRAQTGFSPWDVIPEGFTREDLLYLRSVDRALIDGWCERFGSPTASKIPSAEAGESRVATLLTVAVSWLGLGLVVGMYIGAASVVPVLPVLEEVDGPVRMLAFLRPEVDDRAGFPLESRIKSGRVSCVVLEHGDFARAEIGLSSLLAEKRVQLVAEVKCKTSKRDDRGGKGDVIPFVVGNDALALEVTIEAVVGKPASIVVWISEDPELLE